MSVEDGRLIIYRAATHLGRARTFYLDVDGIERGSVRGSHRLEVALDAGSHRVVARYGSNRSHHIEVDVVAGEATFAAIDFVANPDAGNSSQLEMVVRVTNGQRTKATAKRGERPAIGNPRSPLEKALYALGIVLLFGGLVLGRTANQAVALGPEVVGTIIVVVMFFRSLRYRGG